MATSTNSMLKRMMDNPLYQKRYLSAANQGMDKRAVSGIDKTLGQDIASEQTRMLGLERTGQELSSRKDKLDFARKTHEFKKERFTTATNKAEQERMLRKRVLDMEADHISKVEGRDMFGIEFGLGLASLGATVAGDYKNRQQHKEYMAVAKNTASIYKGTVKPTKYNYSMYDTEGY